MQVTKLAKQIGISRELLHRHIKRGCPTDNLESALLWRSRNLDITQTKEFRITGNTGGGKSKPGSQVNATTKALQPHEVERIVNERTITRIIPDRYFERVDWLAIALKEAGVAVTGKQVIEIQDSLFSVFMEEIIYGYFEIEGSFELPPLFEARIESYERKLRIASLDRLLSEDNVSE
ncbi:hypothetical protein Nit79A3_2050 [Nitrosomonas sp. Is79A3]